MGLGHAIVLAGILAVCQGMDMSSLQPYNLTAALMFITEDLNQDGVMTVAEIDAVFAKYDANGDGRISRHEYTSYICDTDPDLYQLSHYLYDDYDVNGDHHLDVLDFEGFHAKMDTDEDGGIVQQEFVDFWVGLFTKYETMGNHEHGHSHEHGSSNCFA